MLFYLGTYALTTVAAFALLMHLMRHAQEGLDLRALRGLARSRPLIAAALTLCFLSLAGVPLTAGFLGKLYLLQAAWRADLVGLSLVLVATSVISLGYYLRVVATLYMEPDPETRSPLFLSLPLSLASACASVGIVLVGVWPDPLLRFLILSRSWILESSRGQLRPRASLRSGVPPPGTNCEEAASAVSAAWDRRFQLHARRRPLSPSA